MTSLFLADGKAYQGKSFGHQTEMTGEVVFTTGMTGYLEILTDPSYYGQIVVFTFPLIGNYGVFDPTPFDDKNTDVDAVYESQKIWVKGVVVSEVSEDYEHCQAFSNFSDWLKKNKIPGISGIDTREITQNLRESGCILGSLGESKPAQFKDPLKGRYVPEVSPKAVKIFEPQNPSGKTLAFIDCGAKNGIFRNFLQRGVRVIRFPFDHDPFEWMKKNNEKLDGIFFSNGPGDPDTLPETIEIAKKCLHQDLPVFGICLGNQVLALAAGGETKKMKYGHRGVNQPCQDLETKHGIITSQNHGYEVETETLAQDFSVWFQNLNDGSVEGIKHKNKKISSVQFHPEACAGPEDAAYLFDRFVGQL